MEANFWFEALKFLVTAPIWVIIVLRAGGFNRRVRKPVMLTFLLLGSSAFALTLSHLVPPWLSEMFDLSLRGAVVLMLLIGHDRWVGGPPRELLKKDHQAEERRSTIRRRADREARLAT